MRVDVCGAAVHVHRSADVCVWDEHVMQCVRCVVRRGLCMCGYAPVCDGHVYVCAVRRLCCGGFQSVVCVGVRRVCKVYVGCVYVMGCTGGCAYG